MLSMPRDKAIVVVLIVHFTKYRASIEDKSTSNELFYTITLPNLEAYNISQFLCT